MVIEIKKLPRKFPQIDHHPQPKPLTPRRKYLEMRKMAKSGVDTISIPIPTMTISAHPYNINIAKKKKSSERKKQEEEERGNFNQWEGKD